MIYFYNATDKSEIVKEYKDTLPLELQQRYETITEERRRISYQGYALGLLLSFVILYNRGNLIPRARLLCRSYLKRKCRNDLHEE